MKLISVVSIDEIDADDKNSHSYYHVEFTSSPYNIQNIYIYIYGQVLEYGKIVENGAFFSSYIANSKWYVTKIRGGGFQGFHH